MQFMNKLRNVILREKNVQSTISHNSKNLEETQCPSKRKCMKSSMFIQRNIIQEPKQINYRRRHQYGRNLAI